MKSTSHWQCEAIGIAGRKNPDWEGELHAKILLKDISIVKSHQKTRKLTSKIYILMKHKLLKIIIYESTFRSDNTTGCLLWGTSQNSRESFYFIFRDARHLTVPAVSASFARLGDYFCKRKCFVSYIFLEKDSRDTMYIVRKRQRWPKNGQRYEKYRERCVKHGWNMRSDD